jgi:hypothetical protein
MLAGYFLTPIPARSSAAAATAATERPNHGAHFVVAVLNSNQDVLRLICSALEDEGQFLLNHQPVVFIYDVARPYKENRLVRTRR